ncbi:MAG: hypothetical protein ABIW81_07020 [Terrimesophilobacter sp.]
METTFFGPGGPARFSGNVPGDYTPPAEEDLVVQPLSRSQWRVSDRRYSEHDACSLLGFIEEKDGTFELTQLEHGFQWFYFSSLAEAIAHFTQTPRSGSPAEPELSWLPRTA